MLCWLSQSGAGGTAFYDAAEVAGTHWIAVLCAVLAGLINIGVMIAFVNGHSVATVWSRGVALIP